MVTGPDTKDSANHYRVGYIRAGHDRVNQDHWCRTLHDPKFAVQPEVYFESSAGSGYGPNQTLNEAAVRDKSRRCLNLTRSSATDPLADILAPRGADYNGQSTNCAPAWQFAAQVGVPSPAPAPPATGSGRQGHPWHPTSLRWRGVKKGVAAPPSKGLSGMLSRRSRQWPIFRGGVTSPRPRRLVLPPPLITLLARHAH